jgi:hypothetical protein
VEESAEVGSGRKGAIRVGEPHTLQCLTDELTEKTQSECKVTGVVDLLGDGGIFGDVGYMGTGTGAGMVRR